MNFSSERRCFDEGLGYCCHAYDLCGWDTLHDDVSIGKDVGRFSAALMQLVVHFGSCVAHSSHFGYRQYGRTARGVAMYECWSYMLGPYGS